MSLEEVLLRLGVVDAASTSRTPKYEPGQHFGLLAYNPFSVSQNSTALVSRWDKRPNKLLRKPNKRQFDVNLALAFPLFPACCGNIWCFLTCLQLSSATLYL